MLRRARVYPNDAMVASVMRMTTFESLVPSRLDPSAILILAVLRGVLNAEDYDFLSGFVDDVIDQVAIARSDQLSYAALLLRLSDRRKQQ